MIKQTNYTCVIYLLLFVAMFIALLSATPAVALIFIVFLFIWILVSLKQ